MPKWKKYFWNKIYGFVFSSLLLFSLQFILIFTGFLSSDKFVGEKVLTNPLIVGIVKGSIYYLIAGFLVATLRSLYKGYRLIRRGKVEEEDVIKFVPDMRLIYYMNYPMILSLIYILATYFLRKEPIYICRTLLFALGFYVDNIFHRPLDILKT